LGLGVGGGLGLGVSVRVRVRVRYVVEPCDVNVVAPQLGLWLHSCWQSAAKYGEERSPGFTTYQPWHLPPPPEVMVGSDTTVMPG
jgi:hypothetical protein